MTREEILAAAKQCVCGGRETDYGTPEDNCGSDAIGASGPRPGSQRHH